MARPISKELKSQVNIRNSYYHEYRQNDPNPEVDVKTYMKIVLGYILFIMKKVFEGRHMRLPSKMGVLGVRGKKRIPKFNEKGEIYNMPRNHKATNDLWERDPEAKAQKKVIYHLNEHTNGYSYKIMWYKKNMIVTNKFNYRLKMSFANSRTIPKLIRDNNGEFLTIN